MAFGRTNIVTAVVGDRMYTKTDSVVQYDYGLKLMITGVTLPESYEVHFCNTKSAKTKTQTGDANGVDIPDEYLLNGEDIYAYVFLNTGENDGETVYIVHIPVVGRAAIGEDQLTPVEHNLVRELHEEIARLSEEFLEFKNYVTEELSARD